MTPWLVLIYGILVAVGGAIGYVRKDSVASLIAGGASGIVLAGASVAMMKGVSAGWWISLIVALALLGHFGRKAISEGFTMMPGGLVIILSIIVIAALLLTRRGQ